MRAKFKVESVTYWTYGDTTIQMQPVLTGSEENEKFYRSTPSGKLEMTVKNSLVKKLFQPGKEFYVDFIEA